VAAPRPRFCHVQTIPFGSYRKGDTGVLLAAEMAV
jgi:hypothetical protein